jgi:hypothetical protein
MKKLLKRLFVRDWIPVWVLQAKWMNGSGISNVCYYELYYSQTRGIFNVKCGGHLPKLHQFYPVAINSFYAVIYEGLQSQANLNEVYEIIEKQPK